MKHPISYLLFIVLWAFGAHGQSNNHATVDAMDIKTAGILKPGQQAHTWQIINASDKTNADAWLNRFIWEQRSNGSAQAQLQQTAAEAGQYIQGTYQHALISFLLSDKADGEALQKAYALCPDKTAMYPYMVQYNIRTGNRKAVAEYATLLDRAMPLAADSATFYYHVNVLMSADSNAVIYARGQNDLVALAQLQQAYGYRRDITLAYYHDGVAMEAARPAYLCLSLGKNILEKYKNTGCYTGLLMRVSGTDARELLRHYNSTFHTGYLQRLRFDANTRTMNRNYLPALIQLYRYYHPLDATKASALKALIGIVAGSGTDAAQVNALVNAIEQER